MRMDFITFNLLVIQIISNCIISEFDDLRFKTMKIKDDVDDYYYLMFSVYDVNYDDVIINIELTTHKISKNTIKITSVYIVENNNTNKIKPYDYTSLYELDMACKKSLMNISLDFNEVCNLCEK